MSRDGWIGVGLLFICGWLYTGLDRIPANPLVPISPDFYPRLLLLIILALALALVLQNFLTRNRQKLRTTFGNRSEEYQPTLLSFCLFLLYVLLLPKIGFLLSTILFVSSLQWLLGEPVWRRLPASLLIGIGTSVVTYWTFEKYLHVFLPRASWLP